MIEILVKIIIVAVAVIVFGAFYREEWRNLRARESEYEAFEQHRAERQAVFDQHAQEVAHRALIKTCETIYLGRWWHD